jgi:hypothetical protein
VNLRVLAEAQEEADAAAQMYEFLQPGLGSKFLQSLTSALEHIENQPQVFPRLETLKTHREVRRCILRRFPYLVIYEIQPQEALVLAVAHARRRPNYWRRRLQ